MRISYKNITLLFASVLIAFSCSEESNPEFEVKNFTSIFDNNNFNSSYFPIDMLQSSDGGYVVLGGRKLEDSDFSGIYLLKADKYGNFVKELEVEETWVNAIPKFISNNGKFYFFCMDAFTQRVQLAEVDENLDAITTKPAGGLSYPSAASFVDNSFLLLSYNNADKVSVLSFVNADGNVITSKGFGIGTGDDIEEPLINHFIRTGRQFPFEVGKASNGLFYFNGFYNYTFSLVFTDLNADDPLGVVQGQQDDGGFSAITNISGSKFATSRFNFGENFLIPNATLQPSGNTSSTDLGGFSLPELEANAKVKIIRAVVKEKNVLIYAADTKTKQIGIYFYDEATGQFEGSRYLGFSNPFEIANIIQTEDGGISVCGTTYLAGRFPRICIFKISKDDLSKEIK